MLIKKKRNYREYLTNATQNGTLSSSKDPQWDFFGAVFYCVTLVSTIGYGHIACKTKIGKFFTIIYSSLGVPLMMLFLANTGSSSATLFKFIYIRLYSFKRKYRIRKLNKSATNYKYSMSNLHMQNQHQQMSPIIEYSQMEKSQPLEDNRSREVTYHSSGVQQQASKADDDVVVTVDRSREGNYETDSLNNRRFRSSIKSNKSLQPARPGSIKRSYSVSMGIRDVELPGDFVVNCLINTKIVAQSAKSASNNDNNNNNNNSTVLVKPVTLNLKSSITQRAPPVRSASVSSLTKTKANEAAKRIDTLISPGAKEASRAISNRNLINQLYNQSINENIDAEQQSVKFFAYGDDDLDDPEFDDVIDLSNYDDEELDSIENDEEINKRIRNKQLIDYSLKDNRMSKKKAGQKRL